MRINDAVESWDVTANRTGLVQLVYTSACELLGQFYAHGAWAAPTSVVKRSTCATYPKVALNDKGDGLAVFADRDRTTSDGAAEQVWAARYWGKSPGRIDVITFEQVSGARTDWARPTTPSLDEVDTAAVAWSSYRSSPFAHAIYGATSSLNAAWTQTELAADPGESIMFASQAVRDTCNNVLVAGVTDSGNAGVLWARRLTAGTWGPSPSSLHADGDLVWDLVLRSSLDRSSSALVWSVAGTAPGLRSRTYRFGAWAPADEAPLADTHVDSYDVAVGNRGEQVVVFVANGSVQSTVRRHGHWSAATRIDGGSANVPLTPAVTIDAKGNAFAIWISTSASRSEVWGAVRPAGASWQPAQRVDDATTGGPASPRLVPIAGAGALALWQQNDGSASSLWSARVAP